MSTSTENDRSFDEILEIVKKIGESSIAPHANEVDREARFPLEAFDALKGEKLLSSYIPQAFGGDGLNITEICRLCEAMAHYDASTAMIYAMHQIQIACIVTKPRGTPGV